jgi:hypothetical protein
MNEPFAFISRRGSGFISHTQNGTPLLKTQLGIYFVAICLPYIINTGIPRYSALHLTLFHYSVLAYP